MTWQPRPPQPNFLTERIIQYLGEKYKGELRLAIDVGCGVGQNTFPYSQYFKNVIGFDTNSNQTQFARQLNDKDNVTFEISSAERLNLENDSVQLCTAMASVHWFDIPKFFEEARRVLSPGGVLAISKRNSQGIELHWEKDPTKNISLSGVYKECVWGNELLGSFQPPQMGHSRGNYKDITIPYDDFIREENMVWEEETLSLAQLVSRVSTFAVFQRMKAALGQEAGDNFIRDLETKIKDIVLEDLDEEERKSSDNIIFVQKIPFILLLARKSIN